MGDISATPESPLSFSLRFDTSEIGHWASLYSYRNDDERKTEVMVVDKIGPETRYVGHYSKSQFMEVGDWKSPRSRPRREKNTEEFIAEVTKTALSTPSEQLRIEVLTLLYGVGWPTASVVLHLSHKDPYPILDYRALWSVGVEVPSWYNFPFWNAYTTYCRVLATNCDVNMRTLDRALWQYSKEHQPSSGSNENKQL